MSIKNKKEVITQIICRILLGIAGMYLLNIAFRFQVYNIHIGVNAGSIATVAFLGIPGFLLLLGIAVYSTY